MVELPSEQIAHTALEVLEEAGFLLGETSDAARARAPLAPMRASLAFAGPQRGRLEVVTSAALAHELAGGVLGRPLDELDEELARAALGEFVNVLLGHLREWLGTLRKPLECGLPVVAPAASAADWEALVCRPGAVVLEVEGEPLAFTVELENLSEEQR